MHAPESPMRSLSCNSQYFLELLQQNINKLDLPANTKIRNLRISQQKFKRAYSSKRQGLKISLSINHMNPGIKSTFWFKQVDNPKELYNLRVIFGGGGHCDIPYKVGVMDTFSNKFFPKGFRPDVVGMPIPLDLELGPQSKLWMRRLSVAYGLSFVRTDLTTFTYPKDLKDPDPTEIFQPQREIPEAPSKDVC